LTDDVSVNLTYGKMTTPVRTTVPAVRKSVATVRSERSVPLQQRWRRLRPYVEGGVKHGSQTNVAADGHTGRDQSTFLTAGAGVKYYFTNNLFARAGVEADYKLDNGKWDYQAWLVWA
jgi:OOP family OmpA-OmpF porin